MVGGGRRRKLPLWSYVNKPLSHNLSQKNSSKECLSNFFRQNGGLQLTWYVSTNEDVGDFRLEVQTRTFPRSTLFSKDLTYSTRSQTIRGVSSESEVSMCLLAKTSTGRIRRWKQDQCRIVGPLYGGASSVQIAKKTIWLTTFLAIILGPIWRTNP